jgi:hypothetical protein
MFHRKIQTFARNPYRYSYVLHHIQQGGANVANWPIVRPHNSKGAEKKVERPDKAAAKQSCGEILADFVQKGPKKGQTS